METQSARKVEWLKNVSLVTGVLAFLSGIPIFVLFISAAVTRNMPSSILDLLIEAYFDWVSIFDLSAAASLAVVGFTLGMLTLLLNFIASKGAHDNLPRGTALRNYILGTLGIIGNGIVVMFFMVMTVR